MTDLKSLSPDAIDSALERAKHYRLLNEASEAESICRDVLVVDPDRQEALVVLLLALSDQFQHRLLPAFQEATEVLAGLEGEYDRFYYHGILCERRAKTHFRQGDPAAGGLAFEWLRRAMELYEKAEPIRPSGNDDAILRWNTCARLLARHPEMREPAAETFQPLLE